MVNRQVIVPSATYVSEELQKLGKLPAVIYPVNQKITFEYLYEQYKNACEGMRVVCGMGAAKVRQRLSRYTEKNVVIEELPEVRDLAYTVWYGIRDVEGPVLINFADTLVEDGALLAEGDAFYYAEDILSDKWTFFDEEGGAITKVYDKIDPAAGGGNPSTKKLFVGVFQILHTGFFADCLREAAGRSDGHVSAFYRALQEYSKTYPLAAVWTDKWFDIGHADKYIRSDLAVKAREFNHIAIDGLRGILTKTSDNREKFIDEIKWYLKLPGDIEYVHPRVFDYSTQYSKPYISMEYYAYHTIHELYLYGDLNQQQWTDIFERVRFVCRDMKRYSISDGKIPGALEEMYLSKTLSRLDELRGDSRFTEFFHHPVTINGRTYMALDAVCSALEVNIPKYLYDVDRFSIVHGDLCFTNIMIDENLSFIKLIDPRGRFGGYDIYGDFRYELAKLFHSVDGKYDYMIKDLFDVSYDLSAPSIRYAFHERKRQFDLFSVFLEVFQQEIGPDRQKIEMIEALLFLSMIPLHMESLDQQMVMLATGVEILARVIDIAIGDEGSGADGAGRNDEVNENVQ